jgi:hypothetical protein
MRQAEIQAGEEEEGEERETETDRQTYH